MRVNRRISVRRGQGSAPDHGIDEPGIGKPARPETAAATASVGPAVWRDVVAAAGQPGVDTECGAAPHDVGLRQVDEWGKDPKIHPVAAHLGAERDQAFKRIEQLRATVRTPRVVEGFDPMTKSRAPRASAHAKASESSTVLRAGT